MKFLFIVLLFLQSSVFAQKWVNDFFAEQGNSGKSFREITDALIEGTSKSVSNRAPDLEFKQVDNDSLLSIESFKGKTCILNFWSTNCAGCRMQLPELSSLQKKYFDNDLRVVYISVENKNTLTIFFNENQIEGIKVIANSDRMNYPYQQCIKPLCLIVDKDGIIRDYWYKPEKLEGLERRIKPFIGEKHN